jgi:hypothetical protein
MLYSQFPGDLKEMVVFGWGYAPDGDGARYVGQERSRSHKFVPEVKGSLACKAHGACFAMESTVEPFRSPVLGRGVGSSGPVIYATGGAPVLHGFGNEYPIIGN